jgi:GPH family glycoside/pentoside/hexuronide:cation symporter
MPVSPLSFRAKLSYGLGDFAFGLSWNVIGAFLLFFYTDVALLPAAAVGTLFLASRLLDAVFDPAVGILVDRTRTRWGRARPYLLFGAVPFGLLCAATFWSPPVGEGGRLAWAVVTFVVVGLVFSLVNIPYNALMPMMTRDPAERYRLSGLRSAGTAASVIVATAATTPLVAAIGGGNQRFGFLAVASLFGCISTLLILNLFANCRETVAEPDEAHQSEVVPAIGAMFRNRAWLVVFAFTILNFVRFGALLSATPFFALNVLGHPWMIPVMMPAVSGMLLIASVIAPPYLRRLGMRGGNRMALGAALILFAALPFVEGRPALFLSLYFASSLVLSLTMTAIFAMAAETVDYHQQLYGVRNEGLLSSGISLATKIGMALGGAVIAYGLAIVQYDPAHHTPGAVAGIRWLYYAPALATILLQLACIGFYPLIRTQGAAQPA